MVVDLATPATEEEILVLQRLGLEPTTQLIYVLRNLIIAVAASKGGVGKTEIAKEIAWLLGGVLMDLDWDAGGITRKWGYFTETRVNAPLLDSFTSGKTPRPLLGGPTRADLVPSHPDLAHNQPDADQVTVMLEKWQQEWARPLVTDNHPGGSDIAYGSMAAAHVVVVPQPVAKNELEALEGMLRELRSYPLMIIPNQNLGPEVIPDRLLSRLEELSATYGVPLGPSIGYNRWLRERERRMAVMASDPMPARYRDYADEVRNAARAIVLYAAQRMEAA
ncbi:ParA family protein [Nocardia sp. NPDC051030]|uniref:ParA family protein n=1 Tax=Nocardia sp. NPDC051030 TaxID=3155162 RepID=UPI003448903C